MSQATRPDDPVDVLAAGAYIVASVVGILVFLVAVALLMATALEAGR